MAKNLPVPHGSVSNGNVLSAHVLGCVSNLGITHKGDFTPLLLKLVRSSGDDQGLYLQHWEDGETDDKFLFVDVYEAYGRAVINDEVKIVSPELDAKQFSALEGILYAYAGDHEIFGLHLPILTAEGFSALVVVARKTLDGELALIIANTEAGEQGYFPMEPDIINVAYLDGEDE